MKTKHCNNCNETLPVEQFGKRCYTKDGYNYECKDCVNLRYNKSKRGAHKAHREEYGAKDDGTKKCSRCKCIKSIEEFTYKKASIDGYDPQCKSCKSIENNSETSYISKMLSRARQRAKKANVPCELSIADITIPEKCPVLGIPLVFGHSEKKTQPEDNSPSLDRIDPSKGYIKENVAVISYRANMLKNNGSLEEHQLLVEWMKTVC